MPLPAKLQGKIVDQFSVLIAEGDALLAGVCEEPPNTYYNNWLQKHIEHPSMYSWDNDRYVRWVVNCRSLLDQVLPANHIHRGFIAEWGVHTQRSNANRAIANEAQVLRALSRDFEQGLLGDIGIQVEMSVAGDYLNQATQLLADSHRGAFDHVPAAVLAGAVLERTIRTLCAKQIPPIPLLKQDGGPKTLDPLAQDLVKASAITPGEAKEISAWAHVRNKAAHGEFDKFTRGQVESMIPGIARFIDQHS